MILNINVIKKKISFFDIRSMISFTSKAERFGSEQNASVEFDGEENQIFFSHSKLDSVTCTKTNIGLSSNLNFSLKMSVFLTPQDFVLKQRLFKHQLYLLSYNIRRQFCFSNINANMAAYYLLLQRSAYNSKAGFGHNIFLNIS